jgi:photosystem II stability/assembly factor-like uncharacterized protein
VSTFVIVTPQAVFVARKAAHWSVETYLEDARPESLALDPTDPTRLYVGTGRGLRRSADAGRHWETAGGEAARIAVTAVAVSAPERGNLYAGTEPSAVFRSEDRGDTWVELDGIKTLPSAPSWSYPPQPDTHHVRWIEADPTQAGRVFVAIEAGALVRTLDGGRTWHDRVPGGPIDTHTAATHPLAPGRIYSAAGDGYFESRDGGMTWVRQVEGLAHRYLVGVVVARGDPDTVLISASSGPRTAYTHEIAEAYVYRKTAGRPFDLAIEGLPRARGTVASHFATDPDKLGTIYALNNHGLFRTDDAGQRWSTIDIPWPHDAFDRGVEALAYLPE